MAILHRTITDKSSLSAIQVQSHKKSKSFRFSKFWLNVQRSLSSTISSSSSSSLHHKQNANEKLRQLLQKLLNTVQRPFFGNFFKKLFRNTTQNIRKLMMASKQQIGLNANHKESTDVQKPSVIVVALNLLHRFFCLCVRFVLIKVHGEHGPSMPPIDDLLLLESATSIAEKIRTKKVNIIGVFFLKIAFALIYDNVFFLYLKCFEMNSTGYEFDWTFSFNFYVFFFGKICR